MDAQFICGNENRRRLVREHGTLDGIDYLEVLDQQAIPLDLPRQQFLLVHFLTAAPSLDASNVQIEREPRAALVHVVWARRAADVGEDLTADPSTGALLTAAQADAFRNSTYA